MNRLISNQTIKIDNHDSGSRQPVEWGRGVHIHKRMNKDKYSGAEIIIPLDNNQNIKMINVIGKKDIKERLKNEINGAFKDEKIRENFIEEVAESIRRYKSNTTNEELRIILLNNANNIATFFNLRPATKNDIIKFINSTNFITKHESIDDGRDCFIQQNTEEKSIIIGDDLEEVENFS